MAIRPRGGGYQVDVKVGGHRVRESVQSESAARIMESEIRACLLKGEPWMRREKASASTATLGKVMEMTRALYWSHQKADIQTWRLALQVQDFFGADKPVAEIDKVAVDAFAVHIRSIKNSGGTLNRKMSCLSKALTLAMDHDMITKVPKMPRGEETEGRERTIREGEEAALLAFWRANDMAPFAELVEVLIDTGLRVSEAFRLTAKDFVDEGKVFVRKSKNNKSRRVPLTKRALAIVTSRAQRAHNSGDVLFADIDRRYVNRMWNAGRAAIGLGGDAEFVPHACRHTFCSRLVQRGVNIVTVKALAGHSNIQTTMRYVKLVDDNLIEAVTFLDPTLPGEEMVRVRLEYLQALEKVAKEALRGDATRALWDLCETKEWKDAA